MYIYYIYSIYICIYICIYIYIYIYIYICGNRINLVYYSEFHALCNHQVYNFISVSPKLVTESKYDLFNLFNLI